MKLKFFLGAICCFFSVDLRKLTKYKYDDACDVFAVHGVGGIVIYLKKIFKLNKVFIF